MFTYYNQIYAMSMSAISAMNAQLMHFSRGRSVMLGKLYFTPSTPWAQLLSEML